MFIPKFIKSSLWNNLAGLDLRSLALFRMVIAVAILLNALIYWPDLNTFFADPNGFFSISEAISKQSSYNWSLLYLSNQSFFWYLFILVYIASALLMLLGYQTRMVTIIAWILSFSLKTRASTFNSLADVQLVVVLFWAMFLPLGARFSIDQALNKHKPSSNQYVSIACLAFLLNVFYVYFMGALEKYHPIWREDFSAIYYALQSVQTTTPLAPIILKLGDGLKPMSALVYYLELVGPFLLFISWKKQLARLIIVVLLIVQHLGIALCLSLGIFPWVSIAALVALLPALFWDPLQTYWDARKSRSNIKIFYDEHCQFCLKLALLFAEFSLLSKSVLRPAQEEEPTALLMKANNSWIVQTHLGDYLTRWDAVAYLWRRSPIFFPLGFLFLVPGLSHLGNLTYCLVSNNRKVFGRFSKYLFSCSDRLVYQPWRITRCFLGVLILLVLLLNLHNTKLIKITWQKSLENTLRVITLKQHWDMYAPAPNRYSTWLVIEGQLKTNDLVDLLHNQNTPPSHLRPASGWELFPSFRWRKFFSRINWNKKGVAITAYYCRKWKETHGDLPLKELTVYKYKQKTAPPHTQTLPVTRRIEFRGLCEAF